MRPTRIASLAVAVVLRTAALLIAVFGTYIVLMPLIVTGLAGSLVMLRVLAIYWVAAFVLWLLAKPIGALVVRGLADE